MECAGWFSFVACSSLIARCISLFGLFHVRQELQIHLSAGVLKRCQRVSVDFLTNWPQLFSYAPGLEQPDRLLDSREKSLVKMCLLHLNPPVFAPAERGSSFGKGTETHASEGVDCRLSWRHEST